MKSLKLSLLSLLLLCISVMHAQIKVHSTGKVSVGTTSTPDGTLDVYGSNAALYLKDASASGVLRFVTSGGSNYIQSGTTTSSGTTADLNFTSMLGASTWMTIKATTGYMGLGTTSPSVKFHATTDDATTNAVTNIIQLNHSSSGTVASSFGTGLLFSGESATNGNMRDMARIQSVWSTATDASRASILQFQTLTGAGSLTTQLTIDGAGNIGIGTTSPSQLFHIYSSSTNARQIIQGQSAAQSALEFRNGTGETSVIYRPASSNDLRIYGTTLASDIMTFNTTSGNVGVGTTNPSRTLDVVSNVTHSTNGTASQLSVRGTASSTKKLNLGYETTSNYGFIEAVDENASWKNLYLQPSGGSVGIGTTTVTGGYVFQVNGSALASGGTWTNSDIRYKRNIQSIDFALSKILKLNGKKYEYNRDQFKELNFNEGTSLGFIAQELKEILPEAVKVDGKGFYSINYDAVIPVLVEAMKEQNANIKEQSEKISNLQTQLSYCCTNKQQTNEGNATGINSNQVNSTDSKNSHLLQNNPNPFNQQTNIGYYLPTETRTASLFVFDMQGKLVKTYPVTNFGNGSVIINANELNAGMFIYSLVADGKEVDNKRMILTQ